MSSESICGSEKLVSFYKEFSDKKLLEHLEVEETDKMVSFFHGHFAN